MAPSVPTVTELGVPAATAEFGYVLMVPAATPEPVVQLLNAEFRKAIADPAVVTRLQAMDIEPIAGTSQQAAADQKAGRERWAKVIKERGIQPDQ